jgi:hypothetical protein
VRFVFVAFRSTPKAQEKLGLVTNEKMSPDLSLRNVKISGRSVFFDWTDSDGDENHWKLELSATDAGGLYWSASQADSRLSQYRSVEPLSSSKNSRASFAPPENLSSSAGSESTCIDRRTFIRSVGHS